MKPTSFPYTFTVLRYIHDIATAEFLNVGVVVYAPAARFLTAKFSTRYTRAQSLFQEVNGERFRNLIRFVSSRFDIFASRLSAELPLESWPRDVMLLAAKVLPHDHSAFQWSPPGCGVADDLSMVLPRLYERLVGRYMREQDDRREDSDVWHTFHTELQKRPEILSRFTQITIQAPRYQYTFEHSYKNGVWNVFEPVTFDLQQKRSILEKANHWVGRLVSLKNSNKTFKVHFLVAKPRDPSLQSAFRDATELLSEESPGHPKIVPEEDAPAFTSNLEKMISGI